MKVAALLPPRFACSSTLAIALTKILWPHTANKGPRSTPYHHGGTSRPGVLYSHIDGPRWLSSHCHSFCSRTQHLASTICLGSAAFDGASIVVKQHHDE